MANHFVPPWTDCIVDDPLGDSVVFEPHREASSMAKWFLYGILLLAEGLLTGWLNVNEASDHYSLSVYKLQFPSKVTKKLISK